MKIKGIMKKFINIIFCIIFVGWSMIIAPDRAQAKSISSMKQELQKLKDNLAANKKNEALTNEQISSINSNIASIDKEIKDGEAEIIRLNNESADLLVKIEEKNKEIKKIVNFLEISKGESEYLEYAFGAKDFTDFIYRMAVTEQLTSYNDKLMKEYNQMIEDNKNKQIEIKAKEEDLANKQVKMQADLTKLASQVSSLSEDRVGIEDAIEQQEQLIKDYQSFGCYENEDLNVCMSRLNSLPPDTVFWRPTKYGTISSEFGYRNYAPSPYHYGIDAAMPIGTPVYAVANGKVISQKYYPGTGYSVYVIHTVNGQKYTSVYEHLSSYASYVGQTVTKDTIIAYSGNTGQSTGPHLHLSILTGHAGSDYMLWSQAYYNHCINPRTKINFPSGYSSYYDRTSRLR